MASASIGFRITRNVRRLRPTFEQTISDSVEKWYSKRSARLAAKLRKLVEGRKVLIVGAGPALNGCTSAQYLELKNKFVVIGSNRTFYRSPLDIFLSAYPLEHCLASRYPARVSIRIQIRRDTFVPVIARTQGWRRTLLKPNQEIDKLGDGTPPVVRTKWNVILGATDMAVRLGASTVVYLGVEQNNQAHFYDSDEPLRQRIINDIEKFRHLDYLMNTDHPYATIDVQVERLRKPLEQLVSSPFYEKDHSESFRLLFDQYKERNIRFVSIGKETVIARAGAEVTSIDAVLKESTDKFTAHS